MVTFLIAKFWEWRWEGLSMVYWWSYIIESIGKHSQLSTYVSVRAFFVLKILARVCSKVSPANFGSFFTVILYLETIIVNTAMPSVSKNLQKEIFGQRFKHALLDRCSLPSQTRSSARTEGNEGIFVPLLQETFRLKFFWVIPIPSWNDRI